MSTKDKPAHVRFEGKGGVDAPPDKGNEMVCTVVYYWHRIKRHLY